MVAGQFAGQSIVVTGGTGALGTAVTQALLDQGARVHIPVFESSTAGSYAPAPPLTRDPHAGAPARFELGTHAQVELRHGVDLGDEQAAVDYFAGIPRPWATINLVGGFAMAGVVETSLAEFERMWRMNVVTCFLSCRESVRRMREGDGPSGPGGRIVNVAARPALQPTPGMIAYSTAKAAIASMTESLALELADEQIWVNAIAPSIIDTPANRAAMPDADHQRWPSPAELATIILALASPSNTCARGAIVPVYGRA